MSGKIEIIKADSDCRTEAARFLGDPLETHRDYMVWSCPFHAEKTPGAFHVWRDSYHCFSCDAHGDVFDLWQYFTDRTLIDLIKEHGDFSPQEADARRADIAHQVAEARAAMDAERKRQLAKLHESERHILYAENLRNSPAGKILWNQRGITQEWQAFFELGYSENFSYTGKLGRLTTNTLTIPVKAIGGEVLTIRHRLINALDGSRYRPEIAKLGSHPFICDTDLPKSDDLIIVEGEIKAMNVFATYDKSGAQVVGIPSKSMMDKTVRQTRGRNALIIPDPDGAMEILASAKFAGARVFVPPMKIDDFIIENKITKTEFRTMIKQARKQ
ncbi:MAG: hypothetical protein DSY80_02510 [Desulfocapsa sp.]|nr:MAG: hypothetical protein DSY80_02510 [Desulfocapsa sp.]